MCLEQLDQITIYATHGYKVFKIINNNIFGEFYGGPYLIGEWIEDKESYDIHDYGGSYHYSTGFHVYVCDKKELNRKFENLGPHFRAHKVEIQNIVASGTQWIGNEVPLTPTQVVVARNMKILGDNQ